jgi:hypothetical protein
MATFATRDEPVSRPSSKRVNRANMGRGCPWAQDDDIDVYQRGPPTSRGLNKPINVLSSDSIPALRPIKAPQHSGPPWAADDDLKIEPKNRTYAVSGHENTIASPAPAALLRPRASGCPWATDDAEPMVSVAQMQYSMPQASRPPTSYSQASAPGTMALATRDARDSAFAIRQKMKGAGNVLTWS